MRILNFALKHGLSRQEITEAFTHPIYEFTERNSPLKVILVGLGSRNPYIEIMREALNRYLKAEKAA